MAHLNIVYGKPATDGKFDYYSDCNVDVNKTPGSAVCTNDDGTDYSVEFGASEFNTGNLGWQIEDYRFNLNSLALTGSANILVLDLPNIQMIENATAQFSSASGDLFYATQDSKADLIIDVEFKEGPLSEVTLRFNSDSSNSAYDKLEDWMNDYDKNISKAEYYVLRKVAGLPTQYFIPFENFSSHLEKATSAERSYIIAKNAPKPSSTEVTLSYSPTDVDSFFSGKSGSASKTIAFIQLRNESGNAKEPIAVLSNDWGNLSVFAKWLKRDQETEKINPALGAEDKDFKMLPKIRSQANWITHVGHEYLENENYHVAANKILFGDEAGTLENVLSDANVHDERLLGAADRMGIELKGTAYPLQPFVGLGLSSSIALSTHNFFWDLNVLAELDAEPLLQMVGWKNPLVSLLLYAGIGLGGAKGKSLAHNMTSNYTDVSFLNKQFTVGADIPVKIPIGGKRNKFGVSVGGFYTRSFPGGPIRGNSRLGINDADYAYGGIKIGLHWIHKPTRDYSTFSSERVKTPQEFASLNHGLKKTVWHRGVAAPPPPAPDNYNPAGYGLARLRPIKIDSHMEFKYAKAIPVDGANGKARLLTDLQTLADKLGRRSVQDGSTLVITIEGHASSPGKASRNKTLSAGRALSAKFIVDKNINKMLRTAGIDPAKINLIINPSGKGEDYPVDKSGNIIEKPFGGYENKGNKISEETFMLCKGTSQANKSSSSCPTGDRIEEDIQASQRITLSAVIYGPGENAPTTSISKAQRTQDRVIAPKIVNYIKELHVGNKKSRWFHKIKGIKKIEYNSAANRIDIVLDQYGFEDNIDKIAQGFKRLAKKAVDKYGKGTGDLTVKFWLFHETPPANYREHIMEKFYDFSSWMFNAKPDVGHVAKKYNSSQARAAIKKQRGANLQKAKNIVAFHSGSNFGDYTIAKILVENPLHLTAVEKMAIESAAAKLSEEGKNEMVVDIHFHDATNLSASESIAKIVRGVHQKSKELKFFQVADSTKKSYVILVAGPTEAALNEASSDSLKKAIYKELR